MIDHLPVHLRNDQFVVMKNCWILVHRVQKVCLWKSELITRGPSLINWNEGFDVVECITQAFFKNSVLFSLLYDCFVLPVILSDYFEYIATFANILRRFISERDEGRRGEGKPSRVLRVASSLTWLVVMRRAKRCPETSARFPWSSDARWEIEREKDDQTKRSAEGRSTPLRGKEKKQPEDPRKNTIFYIVKGELSLWPGGNNLFDLKNSSLRSYLVWTIEFRGRRKITRKMTTTNIPNTLESK